MTEKLDLGELERLCAAATPGEWRVRERVSDDPYRERYWDLEGTYPEDPEPYDRPLGTIYGDNAVWLKRPEGEGGNAALIIALRNAAPAMLSRLRALERVAAAVAAERKAKDAVDLANAYCRRAHSEGRGGEDETRDAIRAEENLDACVKATDAALKEAGL